MNNCVARHGEPVYLNIYDISSLNGFLHPVGIGLYHTGIEINGVEYMYGMGISEVVPRQDIEFAKFRESIEIGRVKLFNKEIRNRIYDLLPEFNSKDYNPVLRNCNHFSNAICQILLNKDIPNYVNRLANTGKTIYNFYNNINNNCKNKYKECNPFSGKKHNLNN
jgi:deubiquitinase DESI2